MNDFITVERVGKYYVVEVDGFSVEPWISIYKSQKEIMDDCELMEITKGKRMELLDIVRKAYRCNGKYGMIIRFVE